MRSFYIAMTTKDPLGTNDCGWYWEWIGFQTFINLGGVSGIIPLTGVTLPFISYGGIIHIIAFSSNGDTNKCFHVLQREKRKA